jgi:stress-induced-phosphoprotein 1
MAYANSSNYDKSLEDAEMCIKIKPDWGKGYHRKGAALHGKGELDSAVDAYQAGMKVDPANNAMKTGFEQLMRDKAAAEAGGPAGTIPGGPGDLFGPAAEAKLKADPSTSKFFDDPQFASMWKMMSGNP